MTAYVDAKRVGPLPDYSTIRVHPDRTPPGRVLDAGEAVSGQDVYVRAYGSWRPGVIFFQRSTRTRVPVAFRVPSTPAGQYELKNFSRENIRMMED